MRSQRPERLVAECRDEPLDVPEDRGISPQRADRGMVIEVAEIR
jgi:hypothetical protein